LRPLPFILALAASALPPCALAINGALPGGNGIQNASMGGASIALPLDAVAAANNPAGMVFVPSSTTLGLQVFRGHSSAEYVLPGNHLENRQTELAPEGGFNWHLDPDLAVGVSVSGAGAGSDYGRPALPVPGAGNAKTTLRVAEFIPTVAWKPRPDLALGVGLTLARQQFDAQGVIVPAAVAGELMPLPDHGTQTATGAGLRAGLLWKPAEQWSLGVNLKSRTPMGKLNGYGRDLLAYSDGRIDLPPQYGAGVAWQPTERLTVAADVLRILWGHIKVMQDPNGFAWRDQPVWRIGAAWVLDERWTLRAGFSRNRGQIDSSRTVQNLLVPSINEHAYTSGLSWRLNEHSDLNLGYELNPRTTLDGTGPSTGTSLTSKVQMFLLGYHHTF
jgi:long-chain fatty acid transport protein